MLIVFHGETIAPLGRGFDALLRVPAEIAYLPSKLTTDAQRSTYAAADVIVSFEFRGREPAPSRLQLLQVPGAGLDGIDFAAVPPSAIVCNCYGHGPAIAEYVFGALLLRTLSLSAADEKLRQGDWYYRAGVAESIHGELAGRTIGLLGFGQIGRAIAARARAFEMRVHVANRSPVAESGSVDRAFSLAELGAFWGSADYFVVSLPLTPETRGLVDAAAFKAMRPHAILVNVGRGATIDERALYEALQSRRIAGAVIDTWYRYPTATEPRVLPSKLPFHELDNLLMTPHMSAWTDGMIRRRQRVMADNIERRVRGEPCSHVVWPNPES